MTKAFQQVWRGLLAVLLILTLLTATENWFAADPLQQEQAPEKKTEPGGPKQTESDTVIGPKKQAPPKKKRISPKKPSGDKPDDNFTLSVEIELVNLDVVVTDKRGNFVPNLTEKNFRVYEDKAEQKVSNFSPTTAPITIVMVVEFARTLAWWFDDVITPTAGFIQLLRPDDWAALVAYDIRPEILSDFTQDKRE